MRPALFLTALAMLTAPLRAADVTGPAGSPDFETRVRPILKATCFHCHGEEASPKAKLDLRLVRTMLSGGESGPAVAPGKREESLIWERIQADEMPPGPKKLSAAEKAAVGAWIDAGARTKRPEPESLPPGPFFSEEERAFWSFRPVVRPPVPAVAGPVRTVVDAFLLQALEQEGLTFAPEADRPTLIRRITFDLTGLPPTPEEVAAFAGDSRPDAYGRLVERLLASPAYGERWARHWMDAAGYADSDGGAPQDDVRKYVYRYRDWLVRSLNADRPWDRMLREQIAGDEMLTPPYANLSPDAIDKLAATGFLKLAPDGTADGALDPVTARNDVIAETIKSVSTAVLGLTVGCAQCHAHRYDPITQQDYFRIRAVFEPAFDTAEWRLPKARLISLWGEAETKRAGEVDAELAAIEKERIAALDAVVKEVLEREIAAAPEAVRAKLREARDVPADKQTAEQKALLKEYPRVIVSLGNVSLYEAAKVDKIQKDAEAKSGEVRKKRPPEDFVHALTEVPGKAPKTVLHHRGDPKQPREEIAPGEPAILAEAAGSAAIPPDDPAIPTTGRRLAYSRHLTSGKHPLVARVMVNRVWMHHFGRGLVASPGDFGALGRRPTHPELLDWLADDFVARGWSLKTLHRTIVLSSAYRQSVIRRPDHDAVDPENNLLGRMNVRRLEAEEIRDAMLAAAGRLDRRLYGPPVPVALNAEGAVVLGDESIDGNGHPKADTSKLDGGDLRRSLYLQVRRSRPIPLFEAYDAPALSPNCEARNSSTVAPQALMLMNGELALELARGFAARLESGAGTDPAARVRLAWRIAYGGDAPAEAVERSIVFLREQAELFVAADKAAGKPAGESPERRALAAFCQALTASNRFLYVD